jgi:hypothetical protein
VTNPQSASALSSGPFELNIDGLNGFYK